MLEELSLKRQLDEEEILFLSNLIPDKELRSDNILNNKGFIVEDDKINSIIPKSFKENDEIYLNLEDLNLEQGVKKEFLLNNRLSSFNPKLDGISKIIPDKNLRLSYDLDKEKDYLILNLFLFNILFFVLLIVST